MESARRSERRPLNSRSLIASTLLGRHPATLSGKLLVALGELFGIAPGTMRVALTRMVQNGELANDDGVYILAGALAERQQRQDASRPRTAADRSGSVTWDGWWEQWVVASDARSADQRAELRRAANVLKLAELRDGVWLRPANLPAGRLPEAFGVMAGQADRLRSQPAHPVVMAQSLWDLNGWNELTNELIADIEADNIASIPESFGLAAEVVRHLLHDPTLPPDLLPPSWAGTELRTAYNNHEKRLLAALNDFYSEASR